MSGNVTDILEQLNLDGLKEVMKKKRLKTPKNWTRSDLVDFLSINISEKELLETFNETKARPKRKRRTERKVKSEFNAHFKKLVAEVNDKHLSNSDLKQALKRYDGRSLTFNVRKDATYVFNISKRGIGYDLNPTKVPDDMYIEMDKGRAKKIVYKREFSPFDIPFISTKNISIEDINFVQKMFTQF